METVQQYICSRDDCNTLKRTLATSVDLIFQKMYWAREDTFELFWNFFFFLKWVFKSSDKILFIFKAIADHWHDVKVHLLTTVDVPFACNLRLHGCITRIHSIQAPPPPSVTSRAAFYLMDVDDIITAKFEWEEKGRAPFLFIPRGIPRTQARAEHYNWFLFMAISLRTHKRFPSPQPPYSSYTDTRKSAKIRRAHTQAHTHTHTHTQTRKQRLTAYIIDCSANIPGQTDWLNLQASRLLLSR